MKGLKLQLTMNRTDNRTRQIQFMYPDMPVTFSGSYTKTHCAIGTALGSSGAEDGYYSPAFQKMLDNIPVIADRYNALYEGVRYPGGGFMADNPLVGQAGALPVVPWPQARRCPQPYGPQLHSQLSIPPRSLRTLVLASLQAQEPLNQL